MSVIRLHPSIRERHSPRMSAASLAEYLIMKPDQQETILHDSRFASPITVTPHSAAMEAIRAYCADVRRAQSTLDSAKSSLAAKAIDTPTRPKAKEECLRCIETIELFERGENAFGLRALRLEPMSRLAPLNIHDVQLSVQLDLLVRGNPDDQMGAVMHPVPYF